VDAEPRGQYVGEIGQAGGLMRYLALHFQKSEQAPPIGWRGHRFRTTRGYLAQPMVDAREQARASLRLKREIRRAELEDGLTGELALALAQRRFDDGQAEQWSLVRVSPIPASFGPDGLPSAWETVVVPV
jgi:hypothetical protein